MTLFNLIRDWFVQYIFGGCDSLGDWYGSQVGYIATFDVGGNYFDANPTTDTIMFPIGDVYEMNIGEYNTTTYITMGDWLSTTATIICLILICVALISFLIWLFKFVSGLLLLKH